MLTARLILERFSKGGKLLERRERPSRSFLFQFIELLYLAHAQIQGGAPYSMTDISGAACDVDSQSFGGSTRQSKANLKVGAPPGSSGMLLNNGYLGGGAAVNVNQLTIEGERIGIVVGTGVGAVIPADIALGTRIAHGDGAGEMEYGGCELIGMTIADPNGQFTIRRYFTNSSGGGITVQEAGIYAVGTICAGAALAWAWPFCIARDLTGGVAVADTELLRATYVVQITV